MLIIFKKDPKPKSVENLMARVRDAGCEPHLIRGLFKVTINIIGDDRKLDPGKFKSLPDVEEVIQVSKPFFLASREFKADPTVIEVGGVRFGGGTFVMMAGPCAVESTEQTMRIAQGVSEGGAHLLRGGAYKPRTSPYNFQGMGEEGLKILKQAREETGLPVITEALDPKSLELVYKYADIVQIGTRNMQNFALLKEAGKLDKPVLLKRGMSSTIDEWLMAAEYILAAGNMRVMLCERGIRSFDSRYTRNVVDLCAIPVVRSLSHLPIVVDPSHGTGRKDAILPMTLASVAAGADAVLMDVHDRPEEALCDGAQAIGPTEFKEIMGQVWNMAKTLGRESPLHPSKKPSKKVA